MHGSALLGQQEECEVSTATKTEGGMELLKEYLENLETLKSQEIESWIACVAFIIITVLGDCGILRNKIN